MTCTLPHIDRVFQGLIEQTHRWAAGKAAARQEHQKVQEVKEAGEVR
jgi:hypothetical protein